MFVGYKLEKTIIMELVIITFEWCSVKTSNSMLLGVANKVLQQLVNRCCQMRPVVSKESEEMYPTRVHRSRGT